MTWFGGIRSTPILQTQIAHFAWGILPSWCEITTKRELWLYSTIGSNWFLQSMPRNTTKVQVVYSATKSGGIRSLQFLDNVLFFYPSNPFPLMLANSAGQVGGRMIHRDCIKRWNWFLELAPEGVFLRMGFPGFVEVRWAPVAWLWCWYGEAEFVVVGWTRPNALILFWYLMVIRSSIFLTQTWMRIFALAIALSKTNKQTHSWWWWWWWLWWWW